VVSTRYGNPSPSASVKHDVNPNHGSALAPTIASSATTGGPMQGAANTPTTRPDTNTPAAFVAFTAPARSRIEAGSWISYTPNIDSAMAASNSPIPISTSGFWRKPPNKPPVNAAISPS